jgi:hypothetical protein
MEETKTKSPKVKKDTWEYKDKKQKQNLLK